MILIVDALNRHEYADILNDMYRLRARVFGDRLGWDVDIVDGMERDSFDDLDPAYIIGLDEEGHVISCVRALQTLGPHMLSDVFSDILDGEPPLRSATIWEATRFCVDTERLGKGRGTGTIAHATCELNIGALEYAIESGITDVIAVVDPRMDRVLRMSGNGAYDYLGKTVAMGKVHALAGLLDCTEERLARVREFAAITGPVLVDEAEFRARRARQAAKAAQTAQAQAAMAAQADAAMAEYFIRQIDAASSPEELAAVLSLADTVLGPVRGAGPAGQDGPRAHPHMPSVAHRN